MENNYFIIPKLFEEEEDIVILGRSLGIHLFYEVNVRTKEIGELCESVISEAINEAVYKLGYMTKKEFEDKARKLGLKEEHFRELDNLNVEECYREAEDMINKCLDNLAEIKKIKKFEK